MVELEQQSTAEGNRDSKINLFEHFVADVKSVIRRKLGILIVLYERDSPSISHIR